MSLAALGSEHSVAHLPLPAQYFLSCQLPRATQGRRASSVSLQLSLIPRLQAARPPRARLRRRTTDALPSSTYKPASVTAGKAPAWRPRRTSHHVTPPMPCRLAAAASLPSPLPRRGVLCRHRHEFAAATSAALGLPSFRHHCHPAAGAVGAATAALLPLLSQCRSVTAIKVTASLMPPSSRRHCRAALAAPLLPP